VDPPHLGILVRRVVVDDQMDLQVFADIGIDMTEELEEFLVAVPPFAWGEDLAGGDVEGGEQARGPVADLVVGGELEVVLPMRLQFERLPDPLHRGLGKLGLRGDRAAGPVGAVLRFGVALALGHHTRKHRA
jgi:hypothetical protein